MKDKILIVDDEEMILSMMRKCLKEEFLVYTADSAKKALELLDTMPDMILLDINMPGMDGLELCRYIRDYVTCPILFLTARVTELVQNKLFVWRSGIIFFWRYSACWRFLC